MGAKKHPKRNQPKSPDLSHYQPAPGDYVFDLDAKWRDLRTYAVVATKGGLALNPGNGTARPLRDFEHLVPMVFAGNSYLPIEIGVGVVWDAARAELLGKSIPVNKLIREIAKVTGYDEGFTEYTLKCVVAAGFLDVQKDSIPKVRLAASIQMHADQKQFALTIGGELDHAYGRLQRLVSHGPTVGTYHENLLRSLLVKHIPEKYHVATGFVLDTQGGVSSQMDIVIYDRQNFVPRFREGDVVVVDIEAVRAVIEVKSKLKKATLREALTAMHDSFHMDVRLMPFFKGIFAFDGLKSPGALSSTVKGFYETQRKADNGHRHYWGPINAIAVKGKACVSLEPRPRTNQTDIQTVSSSPDDSLDLATSQFLWSVFGFLDVPKESKRIALQLFLGGRTQDKPMEKLNNTPWKQDMFSGSMPTEAKAFEEYVFAVNRWRVGFEDWRYPRFG